MATHEDEDLLDDDDETVPFAANAENKQLDKEVILCCKNFAEVCRLKLQSGVSCKLRQSLRKPKLAQMRWRSTSKVFSKRFSKLKLVKFAQHY